MSSKLDCPLQRTRGDFHIVSLLIPREICSLVRKVTQGGTAKNEVPNGKFGDLQLQALPALSRRGRIPPQHLRQPGLLQLWANLTDSAERRKTWEEKRLDLTADQMEVVAKHGPSAYKLSVAGKKQRRVSCAFQYQRAPHVWADQRTVRCQGHTVEGKVCNSAFSIKSPAHLDEEVAHLRNHNGMPDGPGCGACGTRFLAAPEEFSLNGAHQRTRDSSHRQDDRFLPDLRSYRLVGRRVSRLWVSAPTQASGELDKVVGFPILPRHLRREVKNIPFDGLLDTDVRGELAPWVYKAPLQPASTFMNSLRDRLSLADRAGSGGARIRGSYVQGAIFNPVMLISIINIFRINYNFSEPRVYTPPYEEIDDFTKAGKLIPRALRILGTDEFVELPPRARRSPQQRMPTMRHGMGARKLRKGGGDDVPDLYCVLYRPWLFADTKVGAKLDRSWKPPATEATAPPTDHSEYRFQETEVAPFPEIMGIQPDLPSEEERTTGWT